MEIYSRAKVLGLRRLISRAWAKIFALFPSFLKTGRELVTPSPMEAATGSKDSVDLPIDILGEIFALLEIPDLLRAACVCSSWHSAYTSLRSSGWYKRQQTPCLLYTSESAGDSVACLYSLAEKRVYKLTLPEPPIRSRYFIGTSNGWLVTADGRSELHIVNPVTGEQIALPSVTTIEHVKPIFDGTGTIQKYEFAQYCGEDLFGDPNILALDNLRDKLYDKAFVFIDSFTRNFIVVLIHNPVFQLSFTREGDSKWTWLPPSGNYEDCIYLNGILYAVTSTGQIDAFDLTGPVFLRTVIVDKIQNYIYERVYIVQAPSGDLLQVWREQDVIPVGDDEDVIPAGDDDDDVSEIVRETRKITLYKVDMATKSLVQTNSLPGHVLFLGHNLSSCVSAKDYPQLQANHVYLTDDETDISFYKSNRRDIGVFNLEDNTMEEIVPPQCWCSWPVPVWITPSFAMISSTLKK